MEPRKKIIPLVVALGLVFCNAASHSAPAPQTKKAKPMKAAKVVTPPATSHVKTKTAPLRAIPFEYKSYFLAKSLLAKTTLDLSSIESAQRSLLTAKMENEMKTLDKEQEELFYALEIRRGEKYAELKEYANALESFQRALNGLGTYKWIYYWSEHSSKSLAAVCNRNKKQKDEACLVIGKRVADAFPKVALETKVLRELAPVESIPSAELSGDRLSQTYSEKTEKDEQAFEEVLAYFLNGSNSDVIKTAKTFIETYPKSIIRYRAMFLIAEAYTRKNEPKDAAPYYQKIIDETPISYYAVVGSERLGKSLRDRVKKDSLKVDSKAVNLTLVEKTTLERAQALFAKKHYDEVAIELESLSRTRNYPTDFLLYLMQFATKANQNLNAFRIGNELIGRRYDNFLQIELLDIIFPDRFVKEIDEQAKLNKLDPLLVASLMKQESGFKAPILSSSGAMGLMQLMPFTAIDVKKDVRLSSLKDPTINITLGTKYLGGLMDRFSQNAVYSLAGYNAGPHRVAKWRKEMKPDWGMIEFIESIPYKETRDYVMSILRNRYWYQYRRGQPLKSVFDAWVVAAPSPAPSVRPTDEPTDTAAVNPSPTPTATPELPATL